MMPQRKYWRAILKRPSFYFCAALFLFMKQQVLKIKTEIGIF